MQAIIRYDKINSKNIQKLTPTLLLQMYVINEDLLSEKQKLKEYSKYILSSVKNEGQVYLLYKNNKLVSTVEGLFFGGKAFHVMHFATALSERGEGLGLKLMGRTIADLRANHNVDVITMTPISSTPNILRKLTGNKELLDGKFRKFKDKVKYTLTEHQPTLSPGIPISEKPLSHKPTSKPKSKEWKVFPVNKESSIFNLRKKHIK